jgi:hypothetical protein
MVKMFKPEESKIFIEEAMRSKDYLEIAINCRHVYGDIRKSIILNFVSKLIARLKIDLGQKKSNEEWKIKNNIELTDQGFKEYCGINVFKESWGGKYWIFIAPDKVDAQDFGYGIAKTREAKPIQSLVDELNTKCGTGEKGDCWSRPLDEPYKDWWDQALLNMYGDKAEALEAFSKIICKLADISEKYIDDALSDNV